MKKPVVKKNSTCRVCKRKNLEKVFSLGPTPLANAFLEVSQIDQPESFYPLDVYFCKDCSLLQLGHAISPEVLFRNYVYASSTSPVFVAHFEEFAEDVYKRFNLNGGSLVIDIGSNDGILLKPFKKREANVLGIDPAEKIAEMATKQGIETIARFFSFDLAKEIVEQYGKAKVVTATNVFAHIDDLDEAIRGVKKLLTADGVLIIEVPYLMDFLKKGLFDTVYHEHLSYFALKPLITLFDKLGMVVFDVQKVATHGGSLRVFVKKVKGSYKICQSVNRLLKKEAKMKLSFIDVYREFARRVYKNKARLIKLLADLKAKDKKIVGYGAAAKGNTLLNFFGIGVETLDFIVDDSPLKQGLYTPGRHIPVVSSSELYKRKPDYVLISAWNFAEPIMQNHVKFAKMGGKFIIPVPQPKIV